MIEPRKYHNGKDDAVERVGSQHRGGRMASVPLLPRGRRAWHVGHWE